MSTKARTLAFCLLAGIAAGGCRQNMHNQNKVEPYETSTFFTDGQGSRQLPAGTVPRGTLAVPAGGSAQGTPPQVTLTMIQRGRQRYDVFCSPCHDRVGNGQGMIVRRGLKQPPSFHDARLRSVPAQYFVQVMTEGFGVMPSYAEEVSPEDRWAIAAYIRALQYNRQNRPAEAP